MITVQDIIDYSKPHPNKMEGGRYTRLYNDAIEMSIVGGSTGLYGDFEEDFEVAIIDPDTKNFVTRFFYPEANDDVIGYLPGEKLVELVQQLFPKGFQVR